MGGNKIRVKWELGGFKYAEELPYDPGSGNPVGQRHHGGPSIKFAYGLQAPYDATGSGNPVGRRQHSALTITKEAGGSSPNLFQSCVTNEVLKSVILQVLAPNSGKPGKPEIPTHTIELTNATISKVTTWNAHGPRKHEVVTLVFDDWIVNGVGHGVIPHFVYG